MKNGDKLMKQKENAQIQAEALGATISKTIAEYIRFYQINKTLGVYLWDAVCKAHEGAFLSSLIGIQAVAVRGGIGEKNLKIIEDSLEQFKTKAMQALREVDREWAGKLLTSRAEFRAMDPEAQNPEYSDVPIVGEGEEE